jgi:cell division transport system ATP-binding protein
MEENVLLQLKDVEIRREENVILKDASLTLHNGEFIYIIGKV